MDDDLSDAESFASGHDLDEEFEDVDFYAVLNVPRTATSQEIDRAYKSKCLIFHPDRHSHKDEKEREAAQQIFLKIHAAHTTLKDPQKRAIYDAVGSRGVSIEGWQLVARSSNPDHIRREYEFLKKLRENEIMMQRIHPSGNFLVKLNAAGVFVRDPDERYAPYIQGIGISQSVDCSMTSSDRVGLIGKVRAGNGRGDGSFIASWKKAYSPKFHVESFLNFGSDSITLSGKAAQAIFSKTAVIVQPSFQYMPSKNVADFSVALSLTKQLMTTLQGSCTWSWSALNGSTALNTTIVKTEVNLPKYIGSITISPMNSNIRVVHHKRWASNEAHCETSCSLSAYGVAPAISFEKKLSRYSKIGFALALAYPSCLLTAKLRLKSGFQTYELQAVLCDDQEDIGRAGVYGVVIPYIAFHLGKAIFRRTFQRVAKLFEDDLESRQVDLYEKEEAIKAQGLMRETADRIQRSETQKHGLVIIKAQYGQMESSASSSAYPIAGDRLIDVSTVLQAMVHDSTLRVHSVKSQLPGFFDPCPGEPKMLRVRYYFHDEEHSVTVPDELALIIPLREHRVVNVLSNNNAAV